jgi:hypothetical protein
MGRAVCDTLTRRGGILLRQVMAGSSIATALVICAAISLARAQVALAAWALGAAIFVPLWIVLVLLLGTTLARTLGDLDSVNLFSTARSVLAGGFRHIATLQPLILILTSCMVHRRRHPISRFRGALERLQIGKN